MLGHKIRNSLTSDMTIRDSNMKDVGHSLSCHSGYFMYFQITFVTCKGEAQYLSFPKRWDE